MDDLAVGDVCITVNSAVPALNDGLLVEIVEIDPGMNGGLSPYCIVRLDGEAFPAAKTLADGEVGFYQDYEIWAARRYLRKLRPDEDIPAAPATESLPEERLT